MPAGDRFILVVDTNVLVAGILSSADKTPTRRIVDGMLGGELAFLLSSELLGRYRAVMARAKIRSRLGLSIEEVDQLLYRLAEHGRVIEPPPGTQPSPDRGDQHLWSLLEAVEQACLVTGDQLLLENCPWPERVMSPR
ncbi:MAG: putative toxin-antitoxin system toxin component, PIN family [Wenzhouxiangellaceae bacterium]|nr:MAG: putative toxin-antitoxin system toxin component, PIN family [Wenzhouxiangellaceae bacterium]